MGLAASTGKDNDELVDNLIDGENIHSEKVELVMRLVDRGRFFPPTNRSDAYKDSAWKAEQSDSLSGPLHLSAPCIYASVLENLDLRPGMSFLNVGSGTGYLSTMAGFLLSEKGINHGVELYENIVDYAYDRLQETLNTVEVSAFSWCAPQFFVGNSFLLNSPMMYDRMYCGALVPSSRRGYFCKFLKIGGICVMPFGNALQKVERTGENAFKTYDISAVTFSNLIPPNEAVPLTRKEVTLPSNEPTSLRELCRQKIRHLIREAVSDECKLSMRIQLAEKNKQRNRRRRRERAGIRPVIFFGGPDNEDDEDQGHRIFDIFGQIHQADADQDGEGHHEHGENQDGPNRGNRREREERNGHTEDAFTFEPVRPPRPPARRGRVQPQSDSESDHEENPIFPDPRPANGNGAESTSTNQSRFTDSTSSSSDNEIDLRRFSHGIGENRRQEDGASNLNESTQTIDVKPLSDLPTIPMAPSLHPIDPGPSASSSTAPKPISGQKLQEIRKYFEEPSSSRSFERPRGHRIHLIGERVRNAGEEGNQRRGVRFNAVRVPDMDSSESSGDEDGNVRNDNDRNRERDPGPRNITGILRDLMRLRRQTARLHRAAAPLVRNIPRARSATTLQNQNAPTSSNITDSPLSDGDIGLGEGSSTNSSAYTSARGSSMDIDGSERPNGSEDLTRNFNQIRQQRRTILRETLQRQMEDLQNLRTRLEALQERTRQIADRQNVEDEVNQMAELINRRDAQQARIDSMRRQLLDIERHEELARARDAHHSAMGELNQPLLRDPTGSSSRTRPFSSNVDRAQARERARNLLQERAEALEARRWDLRNPMERLRNSLRTHRLRRSRTTDDDEGPPIMRANSPPRELSISERESSIPTLSRQGSAEPIQSESQNMEQESISNSTVSTAMDESSRDTIGSSNADETNCACTSLASMLTSSFSGESENVPFHRRASDSTLASSSSTATTSRGTMTSKKRSRMDTHSEENTLERKRRPEPLEQLDSTLTGEDTRDVNEILEDDPMEQDIMGSFSPPSEISQNSQDHFTTDDNNSTIDVPSENGETLPSHSAPNTIRRRVLLDEDSGEERDRREAEDIIGPRRYARHRERDERERQDSAEERERQEVRQRQIESLKEFHDQFCTRIRQFPLSAQLIQYLLYQF
uniref:Protein-L-isoaspartate O-methyltransferase domain-containing protein 1 n=1 Tax=Acrobeloides nanus TaxID=290746 RepID=A0A914BUF6_9BILA